MHENNTIILYAPKILNGLNLNENWDIQDKLVMKPLIESV